MKSTHVSTNSLPDLLGIPMPTIREMERKWGIEPAIHGNPCLWSMPQLVAFLIWREARSQGVSPADCLKIWELLSPLSQERMESQLEAGRDRILMIGKWAMPWLTSEETILSHCKKLAALQQIGQRIAVFNVGVAWRTLAKHMETIEEKANGESE